MAIDRKQLKRGLEYEDAFIEITNKRKSFGFRLYKNPTRVYDNKSFDFILRSDFLDITIPFELKTQTVPLEKINLISKGKMVDPNKTVTFSWDDYDHYNNKYPTNLLIGFWLLREENYKTKRVTNIKIHPLDSILCIKMSDMNSLCERAMNDKKSAAKKDPTLLPIKDCYFYDHPDPKKKKEQKFYLNIENQCFKVIDVLYDPYKIIQNKIEYQTAYEKQFMMV